jgi:tetratricopeptide (TPR) repeat protein
VVAVLLALLCAALYVNVVAAPFVGDDYPRIVDDPGLRWRELTLPGARAALVGPHPVVRVSYALNYRFARLDPHDYHVANGVLHWLNALLVFALGRALFRRAGARLSEASSAWAAAAGAALFTAHPLQTEAVTWLAQRATLLAALGSLSALWCYLGARTAQSSAARVALVGAGVACWLLAVGSRESALALPLVIALCEGLFGGSRAALGVAAVAIGVALAWPGVDFARALALHERLVVWPAPADLSLAHAFGDSTAALIGAVALQALLLGAGVALARRYPVAAFALIWFLAVHAGEAVFGGPPFAAEHRNHLALVGPALGAAYALFAALPRALGLATALSIFWVTALGAATHARNELWCEPAALWDDAVAKSPRDVGARLERGLLREHDGRSEDALADFTEAVRLAPGSALAREQLAASLAALGRTRDALPHARESVALEPTSASAHAALGRIEATLGELEPALEAFTRAASLGGEPALERRIGDTLVRLGRYEESLAHYRAAIERDPGDDEARTGAGAALVELGRAQDALAYLEPAVESQPNPFYLSPFRRRALGLGDAAGALDAATMAVRVAPDWPGGATRLVWMISLAPDPSAAIPRARCGSPTPRRSRRARRRRASSTRAPSRSPRRAASPTRAPTPTAPPRSRATRASPRWRPKSPRERRLCAARATARPAAPVRSDALSWPEPRGEDDVHPSGSRPGIRRGVRERGRVSGCSPRLRGGICRIRVEPDTLELSLVIEATAPQLAEAKAKVDERAHQLIAACGKLGIAEADLTSASLQIGPAYDYTGNRTKLIGTRVGPPARGEAARPREVQRADPGSRGGEGRSDRLDGDVLVEGQAAGRGRAEGGARRCASARRALSRRPRVRSSAARTRSRSSIIVWRSGTCSSPRAGSGHPSAVASTLTRASAQANLSLRALRARHDRGDGDGLT